MGNADTLFIFGMGFTGKTLGHLMAAQGWRVIGTARDPEGCEVLEKEGFGAYLFSGERPGKGINDAVATASHVLNSIPPGANGDPVLMHHADAFSKAQDLLWIGVLSTIGVYGEHYGGWIDETTAPAPVTPRGALRLEVEQNWGEIGGKIGIKPHIFRLPGIYGPGRNQLVTIKRGKARRLVKKGQVFNRIHVDDIAQTLKASMEQPEAGHLYNICDDEPAPPQDVVVYACELLGLEPPPEVTFEEADLSPMAKSFYGECKRVRNARIKQQLGVKLKFSTYREGLVALAAHLR